MPNVLLHVLLALVVVLAASRALGAVFKRLRQPPVVGEMVAGILLGPSLLGRIAPGATAFLLPADVAPYLGTLAQVGVILYMFLVGLHLDTRLVRERRGSTVAVSLTGIALPFAIGLALATWLHPRFAHPGSAFLPFGLFVGISLSVTAFPVLARILDDRQLTRTRLGSIALACAAVDDVIAWCLLAFVVGVVESAASRVMLTIGLTVGYLAAVFWVVRPLVRRLVRWHALKRVSPVNAFAVMCGVLLLSALCTEAIGIHALFGAFLIGAVVPHDSPLAHDLRSRLEDLVVVLLLPTFFAFTGLRTQVGLLEGSAQWLTVALVVVAGSVGKIGGTFVAARATGLSTKDSTALGLLMNTRGLMELIVLNVGLDLGVLTPVLFNMLVVMAIVTTIATGPLLGLFSLTDAAPAPLAAHGDQA